MYFSVAHGICLNLCDIQIGSIIQFIHSTPIGLSIYEEEVDPIFALSGISTEVVVSQSHGEGRRHLLTKDLTGFDGIVVVGGDGTFSDIAQGLLERSQRDAGLDIRKRVADVEHGSEVSKRIPIRLLTLFYICEY